MFLLENVGGMAFSEKDEGLQMLLDRIARINRRAKTHYRPVFKLLNAADYGVPQLRERFFIIGVRDGTPFRFPTPTHFDPAESSDLLMGSAFVLIPHGVGCLGRLARRRRGRRRGDARKVGRVASVHSRRSELPLAHGAWRRPPIVRMAPPLLELLAEVGKESAVVDGAGSAWALSRPIPLEKPPPEHPRTLPHSDLPG